MAVAGAKNGILQGKQVAFAGRLASMTRREAACLVESHGGVFAASVSRSRPSVLIVGRDGLPLTKDGRLAAQLRKARWLAQQGCEIEILSEDALLAQLHSGLEDRLHRRATLAELIRILDVPRDRLRSWLRLGLIEPVETIDEVPYFDFCQVAGAKKLCELARAGVTIARLRQSMRQLQSWLGSLESPLAQLTVLEQSRRVLVRLDDGRLAEPTGQLHFDFSPDALAAESPQALPWAPPSRSAAEWFDEGSRAEEAGDLATAARAYREALLAGGPSADACYNLANVLYALDQRAEAAERYRQAIELDPGFCEAWNNLGTVLADLGEADDALEAYRRALIVNPGCSDARYNLADTLDTLGRAEEALPHWEAYLRQDPASPWSEFARSRLEFAEEQNCRSSR